MRQEHAQLHEHIVSALAQADALGLTEVGIELDQARLRLERVLYPQLPKEADERVVVN